MNPSDRARNRFSFTTSHDPSWRRSPRRFAVSSCELLESRHLLAVDLVPLAEPSRGAGDLTYWAASGLAWPTDGGPIELNVTLRAGQSLSLLGEGDAEHPNVG
ncbi:MAG: hypothetical protein KDA92_21160, partial [Planctomycetales bacterium]|nr:hypothetical protein [Planctomycetales bacterium]